MIATPFLCVYAILCLRNDSKAFYKNDIQYPDCVVFVEPDNIQPIYYAV